MACLIKIGRSAGRLFSEWPHSPARACRRVSRVAMEDGIGRVTQHRSQFLGVPRVDVVVDRVSRQLHLSAMTGTCDM